MRPLTILRLSVLALAAFVPLSASCADSKPEDEKRKEEAKAADAPVVFTNDDLERMFGAPTAPDKSVPETTAAKEGAEGDPLGAIHKEQDAEAERQKQVGNAEARLADAEARVKALEKRSLEIANPLLPRPQLTPEEAQAWKDLDGAQRLQQNKAEIEEAKKAVEKAKEDLGQTESGQ